MGWLRRIREEPEEPEYNKDMAASIEGGSTLPEGEDTWSPDDIFGVPVNVVTDAFTANAIPMHQMPGMMVLDIMITDGMMQLPKLVGLFRLALIDPKKAEYLNLLSFNQLSEAVGQWVEKSTPQTKTGGLFD